MNGAALFVRTLEDLGVEVLFGIPGGTVIPLYDALTGSSVRHLLLRHEQAAVHAAEGFARAAGRPGFCLATSGPGATNLLTGLADAMADSVPLVAVVGQVAQSLLGTDAFQEADLLGASLGMVKHSMRIRSVSEIPATLERAMDIAVMGRPGPVLLELPVDVQTSEVSAPIAQKPLHWTVKEDWSAIEMASELLNAASRPLILAGGGVVSARAHESLRALAHDAGIPVVNTLMGKGAMDDRDPLALGMLGFHGTPSALDAIGRCDCLFVAGSRLCERTTGVASTFCTNVPVIHMDLDESEFGKTVPCECRLLGDLRTGLPLLAEKLKSQPSRGTWPGAKRPFMDRPAETGLHPRRIVELTAQFLGDRVLVTEVGQHQMWAAQSWPAREPGRFISSGGLGTMGFGLPAALGAAVGTGEPTVCLAGDGSFMMNCQELESLARLRIPVTVVIVDNGSLGMVRQWQELFWDGNTSFSAEAPVCDFCALAKAFGIPAFRVSSEKELEAVLKQAAEIQGPCLVDCAADPRSKVFPMVPAGSPLSAWMEEERR